MEYSLCNFRQVGNFRIHFHTYAHLSPPDLSPTVFAVGSIGYSPCNFTQLGYLLLTIHEYTHMPSSDTASDRVCRWLHRVFPTDLWAFSILPINNSQICSFASAGHCIWEDFPLARSTIICNCKLLAYFSLTIHKYTRLPSSGNATLNVCRWLGRLFPMELWTVSIHPNWQSTNMLTCHRSTLSPTVFAVGSIEYSLCIFRQLACFRLTIHKCTYHRPKLSMT